MQQQLAQSIAHIPLPPRMASLPVNDKGFPVPWFVHQMGQNEWDFRVVGKNKIVDAYHKRLCWLCGQRLGQFLCFTIGPMCAINRVTSEPPSHLECAHYAVRACPFLSNPRMRRNEKDLPEESKPMAGIPIGRNPGAMAIWITKTYKPFKAGEGSLFQIGNPTRVLWYALGRAATREEVLHSINTGLPLLRDIAKKEGRDAMRELDQRIADAEKLYPEA
jgi:hypothetical protein